MAVRVEAIREVREPSRWIRAVRDFCRKRPLAGLGPAAAAKHWLGTDAFGRDVLSRLLYGSQTALIVGFGAALIGATAGAVLGVGSAYFGGRIDLYLQRLMDIFLSFPLII